MGKETTNPRDDHDLLERPNQEFKRRNHNVRTFTDETCCPRLMRALAVEIYDEWIDVNRYVTMDPLREALKKPLPEKNVARWYTSREGTAPPGTLTKNRFIPFPNLAHARPSTFAELDAHDGRRSCCFACKRLREGLH